MRGTTRQTGHQRTHLLVLAFLLGFACLVQARTWVDSRGRKAEAEFLGCEDGTVRLRSAKSGKTYDLPLTNLSAEDQAYIAERLADPTPTHTTPAAPPDPLHEFENLTGVKISIPVLILVAVLNIPVYLLIGKVFFDGWGGFFEAIRFWLTPDSWSFFRGEYMADNWAEFKLWLFSVACLAAVCGEYYAVQKYFL